MGIGSVAVATIARFANALLTRLRAVEAAAAVGVTQLTALRHINGCLVQDAYLHKCDGHYAGENRPHLAKSGLPLVHVHWLSPRITRGLTSVRATPPA